MFDVFYIGTQPNLFPHERPVESLEHARQLSTTRYCWVINNFVDYTDFDFTWEPVPWQASYIHVWPSQWTQFHGLCLVPKNEETVNYHYHTQILPPQIRKEYFKTLIPCDFDNTWTPHPWDSPYIYVFGNQWYRAEIMPTIEYHVPNATERKYVDYPRAILKPEMTHWHVPNDIDCEQFDFSWRPDPGSPAYKYHFATQHQKTGGPQYHVPGAIDIKYVDQIQAKTSSKASAIYEIDHLDGNAGKIPNTTKMSRYFDNYLDTLKRIANTVPPEHEFVWICSSICDYTDFDFTWHPEQWQATMLHVFASDGQKFGDTFFMHVPTFKLRTERLELLDWYDINFVGTSVVRRPLPIIYHNFDTHVEAVKTITFSGPLAIYTTQKAIDNLAIPSVPLWREKTKTVVPLSPGASVCIVPKISVPVIKKQLYDYAHIDRTQRHMFIDEPLDIVFIDNGEPNAEYNWLQLPHTSIKNRIHRSSGVNGRVSAYQAAAQLSTTPWFFAVFAKLEVNPSFNWDWQPDRMQQPKHYIFHAHNPVNDLVYGHQAMIAYNKQLVLENTAQGLDFTLDQEHEVVPILSGMANYDVSPWMAWRTAFRECIKLKHSLPDVENEYRLRQWLTVDHTSLKWSQKGAEDAVEYYEAVGGDFVELKKSYDWNWLASYAMIKRNLTPNQ